ncbi:MAG: outer membrane beta-barrel protein, partial [Bacteroides sp.]
MYRGRSSQPSMTDMQPVTDNSNPLNIRVGNPSLKPSYNNTVTLFYNSYMAKTQRGLTLHASFNNTMNDVTNRIKYDETTGVKTTMPVNVNGNWNARAFFSFNTPFKNKKFTINTYTSASFRNMVGFTNAGTETVKSVTHNTHIFERLRSAYRSDIFE